MNNIKNEIIVLDQNFFASFCLVRCILDEYKVGLSILQFEKKNNIQVGSNEIFLNYRILTEGVSTVTS